MGKAIKYPFLYSLYLIVFWSAYRLSGIVVSQELDEFLIKPVFWLLPVLLIISKEKKGLESLGITSKRLIPGLYLALILGFIFALEAVGVGYLRTHSLEFIKNIDLVHSLPLFLVALATGITQEIAFRGYLFNRFWAFFRNEITANMLTSFFWVLIHVPATLALLGFGVADAASFWLLALLYSVGACFIFARTKNVFPSILLYVLWEAPIILLR